MNKELIKKYKKEFDHWLNGGKLLCTDWNNDNSLWRETCHSGDDFTYTGDNALKLVINDEYVEFRKALAEGKTVQYKGLSSQMYLDMSLEDSFSLHFSNYRIKPEEPEFKVGDWVVVCNGGTYDRYIYQIKAVIPETEDFYLRYSLRGFDKYLQEHEIRPWQPKPGEWCWFRDSKGEPALKRFDQMCPIVPTNYISKEGLISGTVEPFIGRLPSFIGGLR